MQRSYFNASGQQHERDHTDNAARNGERAADRHKTHVGTERETHGNTDATSDLGADEHTDDGTARGVHGPAGADSRNLYVHDHPSQPERQYAVACRKRTVVMVA